MLRDLSFISSGLRRNDGSIVEGTTGSFNTYVNNQSMIRRPSINSLGGPSFRQEGDMGRYVAFNDPGQPGAGFSSYQDYLDAGNPPVTGLIGTLGSKGTALGPDNPVMLPEGGSVSQGEYFKNYGGSDFGPNIDQNPTPIDNTGIGSLTPTPVNQIPESSSITGSITSPYMNNNQDFDQYLNSYINNQINTRMRDIFSGIMNIFR